jgi:alpha-L-fucosidase
MVKTGEDSAISISFWHSRQQAEAATQAAAAWVKDNLAGLSESVQNYIGDLSFFSATGTIGS